MSIRPKITVIYLWRYENPPHFAHRFLQSLSRFPAGIDYKLLYLLKGFPAGATDRTLEKFRSKLPCECDTLEISDDLFSVSSHIAGAESELCTTEFIFCVTSWSEILAPNWLLHFYSAYLETPDCGIVGATGSFEAFDSSVQFPNPSIRTTAFFIKKADFIAAERGPLKTKQDNNLFECGPFSLSKQMLEVGRKLIVVDRNGKPYAPNDWPGSRTFRSGHQEGLLVSDNRTHSYDKANSRKRHTLARLAWGERGFVPWNSPWRRAWKKIRYQSSISYFWSRFRNP